MRKTLIAVIVAAALIAAILWRVSTREETVKEEAYARERVVTVWSRLAQVREAVAVLRYGERVGVLERRSGKAQIRTAAGVVGWVDESQLTDVGLWSRAAKVVAQARALLVQGRGHTRVLTNLRAAPGRSGAKLYQFRGGVPVEVLARAVADVSAGEGAVPAQSLGTAPSTREDWLFIRAKTEDAGDVAGWVLGRFIEPDLPEALSIYSAGIRFVAWFELNRVPDPAGDKPQFLAVGVSGPEGQPCDFTLLRVYTWGAQRHRYETAFLDSNLCGKLPVRVETKGIDISFRFTDTRRGGEEQRQYVMRHTSVRRIIPRR
jgi:hypothetical protein